MADLHQLQLIFLLLLLFIAGFGALAQRLKLPYPILLVIGGLLISLIPHLPRVALNPDYVFLVILPPLLYSAARAGDQDVLVSELCCVVRHPNQD